MISVISITRNNILSVNAEKTIRIYRFHKLVQGIIQDISMLITRECKCGLFQASNHSGLLMIRRKSPVSKH